MSDYRAPVKDMRFVMDEIAGFNELAQLPAFAEATPDLADAILDEAAKFAGEVIAPLNRIGDQQGCQLGAHLTEEFLRVQESRQSRLGQDGVGLDLEDIKPWTRDAQLLELNPAATVPIRVARRMRCMGVSGVWVPPDSAIARRMRVSDGPAR